LRFLNISNDSFFKARKEEKKENLRNVIEELRRKEDDKTASYHTICEKFKKY